jgi:hypothetical protein
MNKILKIKINVKKKQKLPIVLRKRGRVVR